MRDFIKMFMVGTALVGHGACDDVIWLATGMDDEEEEEISHVEIIDADALWVAAWTEIARV